MLSYAAHRGISLEKEVVEKLVTAITAQPDTLTSQQELDFWLAQTALSKAIVPVDAESLKCAATTHGKRSVADAAARRYRWYTIVTLVLLLVFQIYWLIGATVVGDIEAIETRMAKLALEYEKTYFDHEAAVAAIKAANVKNAPQEEVEKLNSELADLRRKYEVAWAPLNIEQIKVQADFDVLTAWNSPNPLQLWVRTFKPQLGLPSSGGESNETVQQKIEAAPGNRDNQQRQFYLWVFTPETVKQMQTAKIALATLLTYILPILYGALGASAFIVRVLAERIRAITYTAESNVGYELRFYLGAVAGLSIVWFTSGDRGADTSGMLQSLSPLALAFLAGFSVELLFSLLERVVAAFSVPDAKAPT